MQDLWFLRSARRLMLIDIKFHGDSLNHFTSYRADKILWQTDRRPGEKTIHISLP